MNCCSSATSEALEFPALLRVVAGLALTDAGRRLVHAISPRRDPDEIDLRRVRYAEIAGELKEGGALVPVLDQELLDLRRQLTSGGRHLGGSALLGLVAVIEAAEEVVERLGDHEETPQLAAEVESLRALEAAATRTDARGEPVGCAALASRLRRTLDRRGAVRDDASAATQSTGGGRAAHPGIRRRHRFRPTSGSTVTGWPTTPRPCAAVGSPCCFPPVAGVVSPAS